MRILEPRCLWRQETVQRLAVRLTGLAPVGLDRVPAVAQPLFVSIAVLRYDRGDALWMLHSNPQADGRAVIEDVDREALQADDLDKAADHFRQIVEGVSEIMA